MNRDDPLGIADKVGTLRVAPTYEDVRQRFKRDTAEHRISVLKDDGLYRHLRFMRPESYIYGFDLVTWPGYLAIVGDAGDYLFSRVRDMFEFFESDRGINPQYWAEKLQGPGHDMARSYSHEALVRRVHEWALGYCEWNDIYPSLLIGALDRETLQGWTHHEHEGRLRLEDLRQEVDAVDYLETWEWDLRDFEARYLWCCWAIVSGIATYREWANQQRAA